jgi:hypothetical protein
MPLNGRGRFGGRRGLLGLGRGLALRCLGLALRGGIGLGDQAGYIAPCFLEGTPGTGGGFEGAFLHFDGGFLGFLHGSLGCVAFAAAVGGSGLRLVEQDAFGAAAQRGAEQEDQGKAGQG